MQLIKGGWLVEDTWKQPGFLGRFCSLSHTMAIVACGALLAMIASSMAFVQYDLPAIGYVLIYAASFVIAIRCFDDEQAGQQNTAGKQAKQLAKKPEVKARSTPGMGAKPMFLLVLMAVLAALIAVPLTMPKHVFSPEVMKRVAQQAVKLGNGSSTVVVNTVIDLLAKEYPGYVNTEQDWIFNNAGGAMGAMTVLHASMSEYVIIFGTALGTEGHTGRFLADDWFTILHGEQWAFPAGALEREVYKPGDQHHLKFGDVKQYKMPDTCWALEYARGNIVSMLPFGFADTFFSTLDFVTLYHTVRISARDMIKYVLQGKV